MGTIWFCLPERSNVKRRFHIRKPSGGTRGAGGFALYTYRLLWGKAACDVVVKVFVFRGLYSLIIKKAHKFGKSGKGQTKFRDFAIFWRYRKETDF